MAHTTADPSLTIVSGTTSSDLYFKYFAFAELRQLATDESDTGSTRRAALFADQKYNPSIWATLVREYLQILGEDYQLLLRRGAAPTSGMCLTWNIAFTYTWPLHQHLNPSCLRKN